MFQCLKLEADVVTSVIFQHDQFSFSAKSFQPKKFSKFWEKWVKRLRNVNELIHTPLPIFFNLLVNEFPAIKTKLTT